MTKTLLAVDDSVTMRKVLEITFSGEDFKVITVDSSQAALAAETPSIAVIDTVLGSEDGYALAKEMRKRAPSAGIIMLASRYAPYDQARGRDAGADDWADKPFDTQQLLEKVRKVVLAKEASPVAAAPPPTPAAAASPAPSPVISGGGGTGGLRPGAATPAAAASPGSGFGIGRGTQPSLGGSSPGPMPARAAAPAPTPAAATPAPAPVAAAAAPAPSPVSAAVNGQLAGKLGALGLTQQQADAVLALSREVVEKVVWEVVPQLAEAIIKEEIARLTKEA